MVSLKLWDKMFHLEEEATGPVEVLGHGLVEDFADPQPSGRFVLDVNT